MEINTKYQIGDTVYYMCNNMVDKGEVLSMTIYVRKNNIEVFYLVSGKSTSSTLVDYQMFPTKEAVLATL